MKMEHFAFLMNVEVIGIVHMKDLKLCWNYQN